jgi:hypothetical protein
MPFMQWAKSLQEPWQSKAIKRFEKARGAPLSQLSLFGAGDLTQPKKPSLTIEKQQQAKAATDARAAWKKWLRELAPKEWLDAYYASHPKPWVDHRLTKARAFFVRYKADPLFARKWNDARNALRKQQRAEKRRLAKDSG